MDRDTLEPNPPDGRVCVVGAGTMGHGIAQMAALAGYETRLHDVDPDALRRAMERIRDQLDKGVDLEKIAPADRDAALDRLTTSTDLSSAARDAETVIEAVPERLDLKRRILSDAASRAAPDALLATNTSSLSITAIAEGTPAPERVVGTHFFNPVHIMELLEVVIGDASARSAVERALGFGKRLGKTPIVVNDRPGFASSRLGVALGLEAIRMLEEDVASAEDIDAAMTLGYRHPMGPLELTDLVGLDVRLEIARYLQAKLGERFRPPELLKRMVAEGRLGKKSGEGFYEW